MKKLQIAIILMLALLVTWCSDKTEDTSYNDNLWSINQNFDKNEMNDLSDSDDISVNMLEKLMDVNLPFISWLTANKRFEDLDLWTKNHSITFWTYEFEWEMYYGTSVSSEKIDPILKESILNSKDCSNVKTGISWDIDFVENLCWFVEKPWGRVVYWIVPTCREWKCIYYDDKILILHNNIAITVMNLNISNALDSINVFEKKEIEYLKSHTDIEKYFDQYLELIKWFEDDKVNQLSNPTMEMKFYLKVLETTANKIELL